MGRPTTAVSRRATAPVVAVALLVLLAIGLAGVVAAGLDTVEPPEPPPRAALELSVDADADRLAFAHLGGDDIDVGALRLRVTIDDIPLAHQPLVPFFSATGFRPGPTGPFIRPPTSGGSRARRRASGSPGRTHPRYRRAPGCAWRCPSATTRSPG